MVKTVGNFVQIGQNFINFVQIGQSLFKCVRKWSKHFAHLVKIGKKIYLNFVQIGQNFV